MKYLFLAYTIFWIFLFGYLFRLSRKQKRLEKEIENLKEGRQ
ncbi:CcmD family protein [candidate division TA06 bacterium]|nr:CcmD family protein [candidate division TA06 bacterium]